MSLMLVILSLTRLGLGDVVEANGVKSFDISFDINRLSIVKGALLNKGRDK